MELVLANDADFRRIAKCVFQSVGQPIGHAVAQHDN